MPVLSLAELQDIRADSFADDVDITDTILAWDWSADEAADFFASGGLELPRCAASECDLDSARSSIDGWEAGGRLDASKSLASLSYDDDLGEEEQNNYAQTKRGQLDAQIIDGDELEVDEERVEDALVDIPMASVPVTTQPSADASANRLVDPHPHPHPRPSAPSVPSARLSRKVEDVKATA